MQHHLTFLQLTQKKLLDSHKRDLLAFMEFFKSTSGDMIIYGNHLDTEDSKIVTTAQDSTKYMTVSTSQTNKRKGRYMTNSTSKNIKGRAIK